VASGGIDNAPGLDAAPMTRLLMRSESLVKFCVNLQVLREKFAISDVTGFCPRIGVDELLAAAVRAFIWVAIEHKALIEEQDQVMLLIVEGRLGSAPHSRDSFVIGTALCLSS